MFIQQSKIIKNTFAQFFCIPIGTYQYTRHTYQVQNVYKNRYVVDTWRGRICPTLGTLTELNLSVQKCDLDGLVGYILFE